MARRPSKNRLQEYAKAGGLALLLVWLTVLIVGIARKEEIARHAVADTKVQLAQLDTRKDTLQQNLNELSTPRGEEAVLRQTYGVAKPGEEVIIVVPPTDAAPKASRPWWRKVLDWFGL